MPQMAVSSLVLNSSAAPPLPSSVKQPTNQPFNGRRKNGRFTIFYVFCCRPIHHNHHQHLRHHLRTMASWTCSIALPFSFNPFALLLAPQPIQWVQYILPSLVDPHLFLVGRLRDAAKFNAFTALLNCWNRPHHHHLAAIIIPCAAANPRLPIDCAK